MTKTTNDNGGFKEKIFSFLGKNLDSLTGMESMIAVHLAFFYFSGAYYHVSKRIWGMKYIFTKRLQPHEQRVGYEVLGVLLFAQIAVQAYSKMSEFMDNGSAENAEKEAGLLSKPAGQDEAQVDLENEEVMAYVQGDMARKCTLCLESMKDPTVSIWVYKTRLPIANNLM